jgi:hypothetical protein
MKPLAAGRSVASDRKQSSGGRLIGPGPAIRTRLCQYSNQSLLATGNSAAKGFGAPRDGAGIFGGNSRIRETETGLSRVSGGKATES